MLKQQAKARYPSTCDDFALALHRLAGMGDLARTVSVAVAHRRGRYRLTREAAAEQLREETAAAVIGAAARIGVAAAAAEGAAPTEPGWLVGNGHDLAMRGIDSVLDRDIRHLAVGALEDRQQGPVAAIDVFAQLKL